MQQQQQKEMVDAILTQAVKHEKNDASFCTRHTSYTRLPSCLFPEYLKKHRFGPPQRMPGCKLLVLGWPIHTYMHRRGEERYNSLFIY